LRLVFGLGRPLSSEAGASGSAAARGCFSGAFFRLASSMRLLLLRSTKAYTRVKTKKNMTAFMSRLTTCALSRNPKLSGKATLKM